MMMMPFERTYEHPMNEEEAEVEMEREATLNEEDAEEEDYKNTHLDINKMELVVLKPGEILASFKK